MSDLLKVPEKIFPVKLPREYRWRTSKVTNTRTARFILRRVQALVTKVVGMQATLLCPGYITTILLVDTIWHFRVTESVMPKGKAGETFRILSFAQSIFLEESHALCHFDRDGNSNASSLTSSG